MNTSWANSQTQIESRTLFKQLIEDANRTYFFIKGKEIIRSFFEDLETESRYANPVPGALPASNK